MSDQARMLVIGVVSLIIGAAGGWWYGMMQVDDVTLKLVAAVQEKEQAVQSADRLRKTNNEAAAKYGKDLGKLITAAGSSAASAAAPATADSAKLIDSVRVVRAARDRIRATLDGVRAALNAEFDALAAELGNATPDAGKLQQTLDALKQNWPQKEKELETATRGLLVDLGILPAAPALKPVAAPAPVAVPAPAEKK